MCLTNIYSNLLKYYVDKNSCYKIYTLQEV